MPSLGDLYVNIGADTSGLQQGASQAESRLTKLRGAMNTAAKRAGSMGAAMGAAGAAIGAAMTKRGMDAVVAQQRLARTIGATQKQAAGLTQAFKAYGLEQNDVADALGTLADRAQDAASGQKSMAEDFKLVGMEVDNLKGKAPEELFRQFSESVQGVEDPTKRTAAAVRIFGDDLGRKLLPLLQQGPGALDKFKQQAEEMGVAVSGIEARQVEAASLAFERMQRVVDGIQNQLAVALAPVIQTVTDRITDAASTTGGFRDQIRSTVTTAVTAFGNVADVVEGVRRSVKLAGMAVADIAVSFQTSAVAATEAIVSGPIDALNGLIRLANRVPGIKMGEVQQFQIVDSLQSELKTSRRMVEASRDAMETELNKPWPSEGFDDFLDDVKAKSQQAAEELRKNSAPQPGGSGGQQRGGEGEGKSEAQAEKEQFQQRMKNLRNYLQTRREAEMADHQQRLETLREWKQRTNATDAEFRKRKEELEAKHQQRLNEISTRNATYRQQFEAKSMQAQVATVAGGFEQMFSAVRNQSKAMFKLYQASAIANTIVSTIESAQKAYSWGASWGGPPMGATMAAAASAAGYARVQAIRSQSFGGGGGGGVANSTSGGQSVQQTSGGGDGGGQQGPQTVVNLEGETFGREQVRGLLDQLNEDQRDGGEIVVRG